MRTIVHCRTHIDLNQPRIQVLVNHEVVANQLKTVPPGRNASLTALNTPHNNISDFLLDCFPPILANVLSKLTHRPHVSWNLSLLAKFMVVLLDRVIREVDISVVDVLETVELGAEPDVALFVEPYFGRVEVLNENPLSYVKFTIMNHQWIFDVFLGDILDVLTKTVVNDIKEVVEASDASAS